MKNEILCTLGCESMKDIENIGGEFHKQKSNALYLFLVFTNIQLWPFKVNYGRGNKNIVGEVYFSVYNLYYLTGGHMNYLQFIYSHLGATIVIISWPICGAVAVFLKDANVLQIPFWVTVGYWIVTH